MKIFIAALFLGALSVAQAFAVETAPRISDREIIEKLSKLETGQAGLKQQINDQKISLQQQINDQKISLQQQINDLKDSTNRRFDDMNRRFDDMNKRFDTLQWMLGLFITIALFLLGIFGRMLWNQQKEMSGLKASVETQKDELAFIKGLIDKLLPPKGVL